MRRRIGIMLLFVSCLMLCWMTTKAEAAKKVAPKRIRLQDVQKDDGIALEAGDKYKLKYSVLPKKTTNKKVVFSSSDTDVAKVTAKGVIRGVNEGTATITIRSKSKKKIKSQMVVNVTQEAATAQTVQLTQYQAVSFVPVGLSAGNDAITERIETYLAADNTATGITLNRIRLELAAGESFQLIATVTPATTTDKVVWSIDYIGGINVFQNGNVFVTEDTPVGIKAVITATCGKIKQTCVVETVKSACEHEWGEWEIIQAPECMLEGVQRSTCGKCEKTRESVVDATGHSWISRVLTEPTCTAVGEREHTCQSCGETRVEVIKANGHTWATAGEIVKEPTCMQKGSRRLKCAVYGCSGEKTEAIDALGHTWDDGEITKSPTCTSTGIRAYHCRVEGCTGEKRESIDATGHTWTYGEIVNQPTCTSDGSRACTCLVCDATQREKIPKTGHAYDEGVVTKEPACAEVGIRTFTCANCSNKRNESIDALGHVLGDYVTDVEPTCTTVGEENRHCQREGCTYKTSKRKLPMLGHDYDEGDVTTEPNCNNPGIRTHSCQRDGCTAKSRLTIAALGHDWSEEYIVTKEATCTDNGKECLQCQRTSCGKTKNERSIPALGHEWDMENIKVVEPSCTEDGSNTYTCKREITKTDGSKGTCGRTKIDVVDAVGHQYAQEWTEDVEPLCATAGQKSKHCENTHKDANGNVVACTGQTDILAIQPKGHEWSEWIEKVAPLHGVAGLEERTCSSCALVQSKAKAEAHIYDQDGNCGTCDKSLTMTETKASDWNYTVDEADKTVLLKKYSGAEDCVEIPATLDVTLEDGTKVTCQVVFNGGYDKREQTGVFASNKKCKLKAIAFDENVQIENMQYMFYGCTDLEAVLSFPSGVTNMTGTFEGCTSLQSVGTLPAGVTELPSTFKDCTSLIQAPMIPAGVSSLESTFKNCTSLAVAPVLPATLKKFSWTFSGCSALGEAPMIPSEVTEMTNTFEGCKALTALPENIPAGVKKLTMTFYGCETLDTIPKMPETVEVMEYTFKNCINVTYAAPIPKTVTRQVGVFDGCVLLTN